MVRWILVVMVALGTWLVSPTAQAGSSVFVASLHGTDGDVVTELSVADTRTLREHIVARMHDKDHLSVVNRYLSAQEMLATDGEVLADIDSSAAMKIGANLGVRYIVYGSIMDVGWVAGALDLSGVAIQNKKLTAHVSLKLIDTLTGKIVAVATGEGVAKTSTGLVVRNLDDKDALTIGGAQVNRSTVNAALASASDNAIDKILAKKKLR